MIKICFPPGCYGTYLTTCMYNYTDLRKDDPTHLVFDENGSSHEHRNNTDARSKIQCGHLTSGYLLPHPQVKTLTILPCDNHRLDYYNNQFSKQSKYQLIEYIISQYSADVIATKLSQGWNYNDKFDETTPVWILREFFSYWINDTLRGGYSIKDYQAVPSKMFITTQDIFLNFLNIFSAICNSFDIKINIDDSVILDNHSNFLRVQRYHGSQIMCEQWAQNIILGRDLNNPCQTIFDESYVQYYLRTHGYEIECNNLNTLPSTALTMKNHIHYTQ